MRNLRVGTAGTPRLLSGWGHAGGSAATVLRPQNLESMAETLASVKDAGGHAVARGLGRSYGDAAQCAGGVVLDCTGLQEPRLLDESTGAFTAAAGVSLDSILRHVLPKGWFLPVSPGTRNVTVGGAIAADVHGKNHHADGAMSAHVANLSLMTASGDLLSGEDLHSDHLAATYGGMGLTGFITSATLRLIPVETAYMRVDTERASSLESCLQTLLSEDGKYRYSVAWIDCFATGSKLGRAVLTRGDHAVVSELTGRRRHQPLRYEPSEMFAVPFTPSRSLVTPLAAALFNEAWYLRAPARRRTVFQTISTFFHPLDGVAAWHALYGRPGFTQYQCVVPFGSEEVLTKALELLQRGGTAPTLAVLKSFGAEGAGLLSFPMEGWTLALDIPLGNPALAPLLDQIDELVAEAHGRVYLAKDGRLRPDLFEEMYPKVPRWRAVRDELDPDGLLLSDLARRLGLTSRRRMGNAMIDVTGVP